MKGLRSGLMRAKQTVLGFSKGMAKVGGALFGLGTIPLGAGLFKAMDALKDMGRMDAAAQALGMTSEAASGLFGMLAQNGGDFKEDLEGITQFAGRLADAMRGVGGPTGEAARMFEDVNVTAAELSGLDLDEAFIRYVGAVNQLPPALRRTKMGLIGGTDSMKKWIPLFSRSEAEIREMVEANRFSAEDMKDARAASEAYSKATVALSNAWAKVAVALAPAIAQIAGGLVPRLREATDWAGENKGAVVGLAAALAGMTAAGAALMVGSVALTAVVSALGIVLGAVFSPVGLGVAAVVGATAAVLEFTKAATGSGGIKGALGEIGQTFKDTFEGVKDALNAGDWQAAFDIILAGLKIAWLSFLDSIRKSTEVFWEKFRQGAQEAGADINLISSSGKNEGVWGEIRDFVKHFAGYDSGDRPFIKEDGKTRMDPQDKLIAENIKKREKRQEQIDKQAAERTAEIMKPNAELERMKQEFAAQLAAVKAAAATKAFLAAGGDLAFAGIGQLLAASRAKAAGGLDAAAAATAGSISAGRFGGTGAAAALQVGGSGVNDIKKNTKETAENTKKIADQGLGVEGW
jgi:hypothetical protein